MKPLLLVLCLVRLQNIHKKGSIHDTIKDFCWATDTDASPHMHLDGVFGLYTMSTL